MDEAFGPSFRLDTSAAGAPARSTFLSAVPLFASLGEQELRELAEACRVRSFRAGEILFHEGDAGHTLYLLQSGHVKILRVAPDGKETILHLAAPGEWLGELALLDGLPRSATAEALEAVETVAVSREGFLAMLDRCPHLAVTVARRLAETVRRLNEQVQDVVLLDLPGRVAKKLLELAEQYGVPTPEGVRIEVRLTQQELAQMVGAGRGRVNECLSSFQKRGLLTVERERITLHRPRALRERTG
jgi:CRP/FNR family transcriptional regulator/CRP/FNR family cyclic AMP-dependent transcriptional regulator